VAVVKEVVRDVASRVLVAAGATRLGRRLRDRNGTLILYGHRVADDDEAYFQGLPPRFFREQLAYLARHYEIIKLSTLIECMEAGRQPPPRSVVVTFDDGFRDNLEQAAPILKEFGVAATVFVVTQSLSDGRLPWSQRLGFLFQHTEAEQVHHTLLGPDPFSLSDDAQRHQAYGRMMRHLMPLERLRRDAVIDELRTALDVEPPGDRMMTWEHARELLGGGNEIGSHTYSHALLGRVPSTEARWELERAKADLEEHLGLQRPSFCFPAGSVTPTLPRLVRELGYRSCFVPNKSTRLNRPAEMDAFSLVRVGLPNAPAVQLEAELDGPFHPLRRLAGRYPGQHST
jgi:peptidoglycan/xylan/chitin deacetylase (PgdA/CDA1 family)